MIGTRFAVALASVLLALGFLSGCDIKADVRLGDDPIGGGGTTELDPTLDENIAAYFYAGKPVKGLVYSCGRSNRVDYTGVTDMNGRFVCPRDNVATFFVGVAGTGTIKLGQVELQIFGKADSALKRKNVVITPATLYGTSVPGSRKEVTNIFNLLHSLDVPADAPGAQKIIDLDATMMTAAVARPEFRTLVDGQIDSLPSGFDVDLAALVNALTPNFLFAMELRSPPQTTLGSAESVLVADAALLRGREGLYRSASTMLDSAASTVFLGTTEFMVGAGGAAAGMTITEEYSSASASAFYVLSLLELSSAARVLPDGSLQEFTFGSGSSRQLKLYGGLVNDAIWAESRLCQADSPNEYVPAAYCSALAGDGGFSILDFGEFESALGFNGELFINQPLSATPDIDLDNLSTTDYLPRTFELELSRYTDIQFGDLNSGDYDGVSDDKAAFGSLQVMPDKLRYTLMPNGDIVSDVDSDCSNLEVIGTRYQDADGSREYLIGRIGSVFTADIQAVPTPDIPEDDKTYLDIYINVLDAAHPHYGLNIGLGAIYRGSLHEMVLEEATDKLRSKSCDPTKTTVCNDKIEWFNNVRYAREVYAVDRSTPSSLTETDRLNYLNVPFYGQVGGSDPAVNNHRIPDPTPLDGVQPDDICR